MHPCLTAMLPVSLLAKVKSKSKILVEICHQAARQQAGLRQELSSAQLSSAKPPNADRPQAPPRCQSNSKTLVRSMGDAGARTIGATPPPEVLFPLPLTMAEM